MSNNVKILNFAKSGRSTVTFRSQGYWQKLLDSKPDYVIMALGANDNKKGPKFSDPNTTYKENLRRFYKEAEAIGAKTIFVTLNQSMSRGKDDRPAFRKDGTVMRADRAPYSQAVIEVAKEFNAPCIDLFTEQKKAMELIGEEECAKLYCIQRNTNRWDPSHTNIMGAHLLANIIATELAKIDSPLAKEVNPKRLWQYKLVPVIVPAKKK
jgi:lysophospholipase L1-like esterase